MVSQTIAKKIKTSLIPYLFLPLITLVSSICFAEEEVKQAKFLPTDASYANWIFSGIVTNESGESYGYYFQMQRENNTFHATTAVFKEENKEMVLEEDAYADLTEIEKYNWRVGQTFLKFNPINDSWIFGFKTKDSVGFNFRVDMLDQEGKAPDRNVLRSGIELVINQTSRLNGHIQLTTEEKEQFVTAKNAWFRQIGYANAPININSLSGVLCRFNDNSGFYSVNLKAKDAIQGAVTGACDANGASSLISQFIRVKEEKDGAWLIQSKVPPQRFTLQNSKQQNSIIAGFVTDGKLNGFCMINPLTNETV
ncbi:Uncharacterised protein (plasmid) [Legionella adelaidensis]|uniref:Uncharacterized protein n=1 Tax=Legionella adelaidensis TaxID=45056 RepID=A0A0W0R3J7_9GAMM|nr:hypothetical protein [Legionella adelaidensis]KTC65598.1 hypothetical protein Lade_0256 [Legionella adelaidensis]VEH85205.1 Uncharacterised protein [Legionella adelaidensis]